MNGKQNTKFYGANLTYFILIVGFIFIRLFSYLGVFDFLGDGESYILNLILQVGLMFLLPVFFYSFLIKEKPKNTLKNFGVKKIKLSAVGIAIIIGMIVFVLNIGVSSFFSFFLSLIGYEKLPTTQSETYTIAMLVINLIFTGVLPAICEEITHRGMLIDGFDKLGYKKAIIFSAILFGLTHLNIEQFFYATIIGVLLAFITMITGNIIPAMIIHFVNNAINVVISYALINNLSFKTFYNSIFTSLTQNNFFVIMFILFFIIGVLLLLLAFLLYLLFKETAVAEINELAKEETKKQLRANLMEEPVEATSANMFKILRDNRTINIYISSKSLKHPLKQIYFPTLHEKAFFLASFIAGGFVTIATLIWGLL